MKYPIIAYVLVACVSCATSSKIVLPSGETGFAVDCDGTAVSMSKCYEEAGKVCPSGYDVIDQHQNTGLMVSGNTAGTMQTKGILIKCK